MSEKLVSLNELSKQLKINKSQLSYYCSIGLLRPQTTIGKMYIFDKKEATKVLDLIKKHKADGKSLEEIKEFLKQ